MSNLVIAWESWELMWPDAEPLARAHYAEVEGSFAEKKPFNVNTDAMRGLNDAGVLRIATARLYGRLIGYCTWNVTPDIESWGLVYGNQGAIYAMGGFPELKLCQRMIEFSIPGLRASGVHYLLMHHRTFGRGARLWMLFTRVFKAAFVKSEFFLWIGE